ncbi:transglutaminase family protein [soil metagenome]
MPAENERLALNVGCEFAFETTRLTTAVLQVAPSPQADMQLRSEVWDTQADHHGYVDAYGNRCERFTIAPGSSRLIYRAEVERERPADVIEPERAETSPALLPDETLRFVMPSRYCLPDELGNEAWNRFGDLAPGWSRVQAIVDWVHTEVEWIAGASNPWTTAVDVLHARQGVCRDFAHLAISFCRALNIPARYVFGYLPTIGVPPPPEPMDFAAWFEVYLDGEWCTFDARNNELRTGRVIVGRGRDAADVALITSLGALNLTEFWVTAEPAASATA